MSQTTEPPAGFDNIPPPGEIVSTTKPAVVAMSSNPFANGHDARTNAGAVAVESQRAIAEVQGRMVVAKRFPRDAFAAYSAAMNACKRIGLAECAIYSYNKGGKVEGPSIRLAEELARVWGNIDFGINELSRSPGFGGAGSSEMEAYAWDLETNVRSSQRFTVAHIRDRSDSKGGNAILTQERDIYEVTANQGARRMRARILAILPPELVDDAVAQCKATIKSGGAETWQEKVRRAIMWLDGRGISAKMIADRFGHSTEEITPDELVDLRGIIQQIQDGAKVSEFFGGGQTERPAGSKLDTLEKVDVREPAPDAKNGAPAKGPNPSRG